MADSMQQLIANLRPTIPAAVIGTLCVLRKRLFFLATGFLFKSRTSTNNTFVQDVTLAF